MKTEREGVAVKMKIASFLLAAAVLLCALCALADGTWACPACGRENPDRANFCGGCGAGKPRGESVSPAGPNAWLCASCGSVCPDADMFCMNCAAGRTPSCESAVLTDEAPVAYMDPQAAFIETFPGSFSSEDEQRTLRYTAPVTGRYFLWLEEARSGFSMRMGVRDSRGEQIDYTYPERGEGMGLDLEAGAEYTLEFEQYRDLGAYTAALGVARPILDLGSALGVRDSVSFSEQRNRYAFTAPLSGVYRFWIERARSGLEFRIDITDSQGYTIDYEYVEQGDGMTCTLEQGQQYTLTVQQQRDTGEYTLRIGAQGRTLDFTLCRVLGGRMDFEDRDDVFRFTADKGGEWRLSLDKAPPDMTVVLTVYDADGHRLAYEYLSQGDWFNVQVEEGKAYFLHAAQSSGLGEYVARVRPGEQ